MLQSQSTTPRNSHRASSLVHQERLTGSMKNRSTVDKKYHRSASKDKLPALHYAAKHGDKEALLAALKKCRNANDVDAMADENTPLMLAAFNGHVDCLQLLLQHGADARKTAQDGHTAQLCCTVRSQGGAVSSA